MRSDLEDINLLDIQRGSRDMHIHMIDVEAITMIKMKTM